MIDNYLDKRLWPTTDEIKAAKFSLKALNVMSSSKVSSS